MRTRPRCSLILVAVLQGALALGGCALPDDDLAMSDDIADAEEVVREVVDDDGNLVESVPDSLLDPGSAPGDGAQASASATCTYTSTITSPTCLSTTWYVNWCKYTCASLKRSWCKVEYFKHCTAGTMRAASCYCM